MGIPTIARMPNFNSVAVGQVSSINLSTASRVYYGLIVNLSHGGTPADQATFAADVDEIRLEIDGREHWSLSGADLVSLLNFYGWDHTDGQFLIPLSRKYFRTIEGQENFAWGMQDVDTFTVEIKLAAGGTANPALSLSAEYEIRDQPLGAIIAIKTSPFSAANSGPLELADLPTDNEGLAALHVFSDVVTSFGLDVDNRKIVEADIATLHHLTKGRADRFPQDDVVHYEATKRDRFSEALPIKNASDFRVKLETSGAGNGRVVMETLQFPKTVVA